MSKATKEKWTARWCQVRGSIKKTWGVLIGDWRIQAEADHERWLAQTKERLAIRQEEIETRVFRN